jgi:hypothetical protein
MSRNELFDILLQHIYDNPNQFWIIPSWCEKELNITDRNLINSIVDELNERDWVTHKISRNYSVMINYNGQKIIEKYGSYSSFAESLNKAYKRTQAEKTVKIILSVIGGLGVIYGCVFTYLNYEKEAVIKKQNIKIEMLQKKIDSLETEIKKHPTTAILS